VKKVLIKVNKKRDWEEVEVIKYDYDGDHYQSNPEEWLTIKLDGKIIALRGKSGEFQTVRAKGYPGYIKVKFIEEAEQAIKEVFSK